MLENLRHAYKDKLIIIAGLIGLMAVIGISSLSLVSTATAEKRDCRVQNSAVKSAWYAGGFGASKEQTVPSSSECLDINIRNIKNSDPTISKSDPDKYCAYFKVAMYKGKATEPTYYSKEKRVCSKDPSTSSKTNGPVIPIATSVQDGTRYRVLHKGTDPEKRVSYQLVD